MKNKHVIVAKSKHWANADNIKVQVLASNAAPRFRDAEYILLY